MFDAVNEAEKKSSLAIHNDCCIHCAQCLDSFPTEAMQMDQRFEIAAFDRHDLNMGWELEF
jgi:formate hydrogenlyase subunit 6/NADH:ubiquinone oxidoreductase subunit I